MRYKQMIFTVIAGIPAGYYSNGGSLYDDGKTVFVNDNGLF